MADNLAFAGSLLLGAEVAQWFAALAYVFLFAPVRWLLETIRGFSQFPKGRSNRIIALGQRFLRIAVNAVVLPFWLLMFLALVPFVLFAMLAYVVNLANRWLNVKAQMLLEPNMPQLLRAIRLGIRFEPNVSRQIPTETVTEQKVANALKQRPVPFFAMIGLLLVLVSFALDAIG